ncbi:MAG: hypothetical protein AB1414_01295 [bacterium]
MAVIWFTPTEITPGTANAWTDADVSGSVPTGSTGVILHFENTGTTTTAVGFRKNGSGDNRTQNLYSSSHFWCAIGVDTNRILELYLGNITSVNVWLVGYFGSDASFFTNAVDKSLSSSGTWLDIDISADTGIDTAIGAIFEVTGAVSANWGIRKNGSSDSRIKDVDSHGAAIIGVDSSEICEGYVSTTTAGYFLVGYVTEGSTFYTNAVDMSLSESTIWEESFTGETFPPSGWTTGGDANWTRDATTYDTSPAAANSGVITHNQNTWLDKDITLSQEAVLKFKWKVSSESGYDCLCYCQDMDATCTRTNNTAKRSGEGNWAAYTSSALTIGDHSLRWLYAKDSSVSSGTDEGWIDTLSLVAGVEVWIDLATLASGATGGYFEIVSGSYQDKFGLRKNGSSENIYWGAAGENHAFGLVEADANGKIEGKIANENMDFYLVGYAGEAAPPEGGQMTLSTKYWGT